MIITSLLLLGKLSLWTYTDQIRIGFQHFDRILTNLGHKLVSKLWSPEVTGVAPRTHPGEVTPRIPHSHQPGCYQYVLVLVLELVLVLPDPVDVPYIEDGVSMTGPQSSRPDHFDHDSESDFDQDDDFDQNGGSDFD